MTNLSSDAGIPILTEVIPAPQPAEPRREPVTPPAPAAARNDDVTAPEVRPLPALEEEEWQRLERDIHERVLYQVLERIDFVLEQRVRDSLADVLQTAVDGLASELKSGLHHSLRDVVTRAVAQEITKLKSAKK